MDVNKTVDFTKADKNIPLEICIKDKRICYQKGQTLLESLESANVEVHFHCRDGFCGACRVKLNKGQITYIQGEPLAFIRPGEILTCCSIPDGDVDLSIE